MMLFIAGLSCLIVLASGQKAPAFCTEDHHIGQNFCSDCLHVVTCNEAGPAVETVAVDTCPVGKVCGAIGTTVTCVTDRVGTPCECNKPICDPFTSPVPTLALCTPSGVVGHYPCATPTTACVDGACVVPGSVPTTPAPPSTPTLVDVCAAGKYPVGKFFPLPQTCKRGVFCVADGVGVDAHLQCGEQEYFSGPKVDCAPLPVKPCDECKHGLCPDKSDCTKYVICVDSMIVEENKCTEAGSEFYDTVTMRCTDDTAVCDQMTKCIFP